MGNFVIIQIEGGHRYFNKLNAIFTFPSHNNTGIIINNYYY